MRQDLESVGKIDGEAVGRWEIIKAQPSISQMSFKNLIHMHFCLGLRIRHTILLRTQAHIFFKKPWGWLGVDEMMPPPGHRFIVLQKMSVNFGSLFG